MRRVLVLSVVCVLFAGCGEEGPVAEPDQYVAACEDHFEGRTSERLRDAAAREDTSEREFYEEVYDAVGAQAPIEGSNVSPNAEDTQKRDIPQGTPPAPAGVRQTSP